ncbi:peptidase C1 [Cytophagales bacterium WSM2-2]|nr:peptidase C1 [Cytophagales bacterium WSM2-2]
MHKISRFGWLPDIPDHRDLTYAAPRPLLRKLPVKVDLSGKCPPIYDQGQLGSCTANAIGAAFEFGLRKQNQARDFMPSRLFIYYNERVIENTVNSDAGAMIRDGIKSVNKQGVCPESLWPYHESAFSNKPSGSCFTEALNHQVTSYHRVTRNLNQMKSCLAEGYPFVFGFTVYESFEGDEVARTGKLNLPKKGEVQTGGHAVMAVGYNSTSKRFIVRNSWGSAWGLKGYFTMPFEYLLNENLSDDFWTIRLVEDNPAAKKMKK